MTCEKLISKNEYFERLFKIPTMQREREHEHHTTQVVEYIHTRWHDSKHERFSLFFFSFQSIIIIALVSFLMLLRECQRFQWGDRFIVDRQDGNDVQHNFLGQC